MEIKKQMKTSLEIGTITVVISCLLISLGVFLAPKKQYICADFLSQNEAQSVFVKDKVKHKRLDHNHNEIACETYHYK